ncbi:MAG: hypothetical protein R3Y56_06325 [Akkermansia sp.]
MPPLTTTARALLSETRTLISRLFLIALFITLAGTYYAHIHNEQVYIKQELRELQCELSISQMQTKQLQAKAESLSNRWTILDRLNQNHSELSHIKEQQVEFLNIQDSGIVAHNQY